MVKSLKVTMGVGLGVVIVAAFFLSLPDTVSVLPNVPVADDATGNSEGMVENNDTQFHQLTGDEVALVDEQTAAAIEMAQRETLAMEKKAQLDLLIIDYDNGLSDPVKRAENQEKISLLMAEYNQLILPVALAKLRAER